MLIIFIFVVMCNVNIIITNEQANGRTSERNETADFGWMGNGSRVSRSISEQIIYIRYIIHHSERKTKTNIKIIATSSRRALCFHIFRLQCGERIGKKWWKKKTKHEKNATNPKNSYFIFVTNEQRQPHKHCRFVYTVNTTDLSAVVMLCARCMSVHEYV